MGWFSKKSKDKTDQDGQSAPSNNPYAQDTASKHDAYDPKPANGHGGMNGAPPSYSESNSRNHTNGYASEPFEAQRRNEKSPVPSGGYGGQSGYGSSHGYTGERNYGGDSGYGGGRYAGTDSRANQQGYGNMPSPQGDYRTQPRRAGHDGSMGSLEKPYSLNSTDRDSRKDELFGAAALRNSKQNNNIYSSSTRRANDYQSAPNQDREALLGSAQERFRRGQGQSTHYGPGDYDHEYMAGQPGTGTNDPENDEEYQLAATKKETSQLRDETLSSTQRSLQAMQAATSHLENTLQNLGVQQDNLNNAEKNLREAEYGVGVSDGKVGKIDKMSRVPFFIPVGEGKKQKAFNDAEDDTRFYNRSKAREAAKEEEIKQKQLINERLGKSQKFVPPQRRNVVNPKFDMDDDEEETRKENDIEHNIDTLAHGMSILRAGAETTGQVLDHQNKQIERMAPKVEGLDANLHKQTRRLDRIK